MRQAFAASSSYWASITKAVTVGLIFVCLASPLAFAQTGASIEARTSAVNRILSDYRDDQAKRDPEAESLAGDKRYDDQLSDFSAAAANAILSRGQTYIQRLSEIDTAGLPQQTRASAENLLNSLIDQQAGDQAKTWLRPIDQLTRLHTQLLSLAEKLTFDNAKDYDDYIARLKKLPNAFSQIMTNVQLASDAGRVMSQASIDKILTQIQAVVSQPTETSPFAAPLKRFPAAVPSGDRKRITADLLDTITNDVIPGYQRVGRFVSTHSGPAPSTASASPLSARPAAQTILAR